MRNDDVVVAHQGIEVGVRVLDVRHQPRADQVFRTTKRAHDAPDHIALLRVDVRPNRMSTQSRGFGVRHVVLRNRENDLMASRLERTTQPDVRIQVTKGSERSNDELQAWEGERRMADERATQSSPWDTTR